jgi:hypothetical protein
MLRMRPKPPVGLETLNTDEPWSAMDMADLEELLTAGKPLHDIADYLCATSPRSKPRSPR